MVKTNFPHSFMRSNGVWCDVFYIIWWMISITFAANEIDNGCSIKCINHWSDERHKAHIQQLSVQTIEEIKFKLTKNYSNIHQGTTLIYILRSLCARMLFVMCFIASSQVWVEWRAFCIFQSSLQASNDIRLAKPFC